MSLIVTLADVKAHLRYPNPSAPHPDDSALVEAIEAADEVIRFECDDILPAAYSEQHDGGTNRIYLFHRPLLSVQGVQESWGYVSYDLDYQQVGTGGMSMYAYSIDSAEVSEISRRSVADVPIPFVPGDSNISVQYTAGLVPAPANIKRAVKELVAHWWQNSQLRSGSTGAGAPNAAAFDAVIGAQYSRDTESGNQNINIGVPERILELIKGNRHMPIIA
jgi:hypothetical protein